MTHVSGGERLLHLLEGARLGLDPNVAFVVGRHPRPKSGKIAILFQTMNTAFVVEVMEWVYCEFRNFVEDEFLESVYQPQRKEGHEAFFHGAIPDFNPRTVFTRIRFRTLSQAQI